MPITSRLVRVAAVLFAFASMAPSIGSASSVTLLQWTAPGDDGNTGTATRYDIRRSTVPITATNFATSDTVGKPPQPAVAGTAQSCWAVLPQDGTTYYFAIRTVDDAGNWSALSNVVSVLAPIAALRDPLPTQASFAPPSPNPASERSVLTLEVPALAHSEVDAYDVSGRRVRHVFDGELVPGVHDVEWNLRDDRGGRVSGGVYFVRVRIGAWTRTRRVVVVS